ncbi:protein kinase, PfPK7 homolog, putative [Eimeria tenella]|uniref:Protein kinase, PfPK7 homolog, putative n=1 Tax=Eimeria tenella TaxID=5802 RepID=U6KW48_EIMTE|nr:protein kinase, PfPK7 homolog, putative [Eimeria tenella]CDJ40569.1 protein kinase, PfPK7 homolog, putative [Eimeria tenella]|eukprot:XP_013231319.1 protein kinase, PfPK7 homolog, putative [Eimeria tenella]
MMHRPSPRMEGVDVKLASKCRRPDGSVWLNQYRVCEKLASTELSSVFRVEEANPASGVTTSFCCKRYRKMLLLRRREYRPGPTGMGFMAKMEDVKEEARILALLDHPRCLKLKDVLDSNPESADGKVYFITNFLPGGALMVLNPMRDEELVRSCQLSSDAPEPVVADMSVTEDIIREKFTPQLETLRTFTEAQAKCFIRDAAEGLAYLHEHLGICHRDLKVDNLLLGADGRVCVGDFGSAEKIGANGKVRHTKGTYMFMAPECLRPVEESKPYEGHDGRAADVWALGICAYVMVFGSVPFSASSIESLFEAIGEGIVTIPDSPPISQELRNFFLQVLHPEWQDRISVHQILEHPWVASANSADAAAYAQALLRQRAERRQRPA